MEHIPNCRTIIMCTDAIFGSLFLFGLALFLPGTRTQTFILNIHFCEILCISFTNKISYIRLFTSLVYLLKSPTANYWNIM